MDMCSRRSPFFLQHHWCLIVACIPLSSRHCFLVRCEVCCLIIPPPQQTQVPSHPPIKISSKNSLTILPWRRFQQNQLPLAPTSHCKSTGKLGSGRNGSFPPYPLVHTVANFANCDGNLGLTDIVMALTHSSPTSPARI